MKTTDVPFLKEPTVSSTSEPKKAAKAAEPVKVTLAPAGASGDPAVHSLLAERQTAVSNGDAEAVAAVDDALAKLGFSAR